MLNAMKFDIYTEEIINDFRKFSIDGDSLASFVINKFKRGEFISDKGVMNSLKILTILEFEKKWGDKNGICCKMTVSIIDSLLSYIYERDMLKLNLLEKKANIDNSLKSDDLKENYLQMLEIIDSTNTNLFVKKSGISMKVADIYFKVEGNKEYADKYYSDVLLHPFYEFKDWDIINTMKSDYILACQRLIELNRGDIKGLMEIYYVPSVSIELDPLLKKHIEAAGGDWELFLKERGE
jgi:hypothetical protein